MLGILEFRAWIELSISGWVASSANHWAIPPYDEEWIDYYIGGGIHSSTPRSPQLKEISTGERIENKRKEKQYAFKDTL